MTADPGEHSQDRLLDKNSSQTGCRLEGKLRELGSHFRRGSWKVALAVKSPPANTVMQETGLWSLRPEDPLEEAMKTHPSIIAWRPHRERSLEGYGSQGCKDWTPLKQLRIHAHRAKTQAARAQRLNWVRLFVGPWLFCPWDFPGKKTGMGCHFVLQGIYQTQGPNLWFSVSPASAGGFFTPEPPGEP